MIKTDILKAALLESTLKEIQAIEEINYPEIKTDYDYDNKIYKMINMNKVISKHRSKRFAILIAAILVCLTMMMSISAIRVRIIDFVVSIYDKFVCLSVEETSTSFPKTINRVY